MSTRPVLGNSGRKHTAAPRALSAVLSTRHRVCADEEPNLATTDWLVLKHGPATVIKLPPAMFARHGDIAR